MEQILVSAELAARLVGRSERTFRQQIAYGAIPAVKVDGSHGGGTAGQVYRVPLDALPYEAQILYYSSLGGEANSNV